MSSMTSYIDLKSFSRKVGKMPDTGKPEKSSICSESITPQELSECFLKMYTDLLKYGAINIRQVDFDSIGEGDLEDFYSFLEYYSHDLFHFGETLLSFKPAAAAAQVFI